MLHALIRHYISSCFTGKTNTQ